MPRFPVNFRRKSTVLDDQTGPVEPSFRVLDRSQVVPGHASNKSFDGGAKMRATGGVSKSSLTEVTSEDNLFADMKTNRGSGSSNTTKTTSDNSSRHSNASTAPSSTDYAAQDDLRGSTRKPLPPLNDASPPPPPAKASSGFLKSAGRTFSFGGNKKNNLPALPAEENPVPNIPDIYEPRTPGGRSRAETASTVTTATPPKVEDRDFMLDLGGDLSNMLSAFNKRASVATIKDDNARSPMAARNLTGNRGNQPAPLDLDKSTNVEPPPHSWASQNSHDGLLDSRRNFASPANGITPPPVPRHGTSPVGRTRVGGDEEDSGLLKDSLAASRFLSSGDAPATRGYRRNEDTISSLRPTYTMPSRLDPKADDDNLFEASHGRSPRISRLTTRSHTQPQNKVMTPAEFEKYRQDKVRQSLVGTQKEDSDNDEEDNYDDDEDDRERTKELAKQRRQQEAHMTVYRQQMMKVTGEQGGLGNATASRPRMSMSFSTPNLPGTITNGQRLSGSNSPPSDGSEEDEEIPLAILAAHGFPSRNRPPTRLSTVGSNPNLRASMAPSHMAGSSAGDSHAPGGGAGGRLPAFARKLPQDPFLGSSLVNQAPRESFMLAGGAPAPGPNRAAPPGGLVGVIANEERQRAMRRGSPNPDAARNGMPPQMQMQPNGGFDPASGIPPQMMYPMGMPQMPMMSPGDQAQMQMNQQMQQFMQMQMQFMQMMTGGQNQGQMLPQGQGNLRPMSHMPTQSMGSLPDPGRSSFLGDPMMMGLGNGSGFLDPARGDVHQRTMSMVQPSSASWVQPPQAGYTPSIRIQGYAPSIAPSERSNIGLPGRYRPVSSMNPLDTTSRTNTMSSAIPNLSRMHTEPRASLAPAKDDDDDDEQGWEAMKAKREKKKSIWRSKKNYGSDIGALIN